ncbi:MAG: DnaJ C-terminal domain-containing protein [Gammaproteobacteria bacterium]
MEYKDYYKIMGLARDATQDDIKRAYRKLARKYHPDVSKEPAGEEKFKAIGEAYEVLKDPEKRAAYDRLGTRWQAGQEFHPPPGWDHGFEFHRRGFGTGAGPTDFSDFFEALFGRGFGTSSTGVHARSEDSHAKVLIDLEDTYHGAIRTIALRSTTIDQHGRPQTRERALKVKIPKGIRPGQNIRLAGEGTSGAVRGSAGDLYLEVELKPHPWYRVGDGGDVYLDLPVAPWEAALGASVKTPTPSGAVELKIPAGSASGQKLRLRGRGIPGNPPGDLYAVLQIALPPADTQAAKDIYQKMARELAFNPRAFLNDGS